MNLNQDVLVLNRLWQVVGVCQLRTTFENMCRNAIMALDTSSMKPMTWDEWIKLPIRATDQVIQTVRGPVRVPTVVLCVSYQGRKPKRPKLTAKAIAERDGYVCQVTGEFAPEGNVDHDIPRSRGGKNTWENLRWMRRDLNAKKADRTLAEMGWKPLRAATKPKAKTPEQAIEVRHPDWKMFLKK